jgi:hypothetical protein
MRQEKLGKKSRAQRSFTVLEKLAAVVLREALTVYTSQDEVIRRYERLFSIISRDVSYGHCIVGWRS